MRLVKLPSGANKGKSLYINPDNVTVLYEGDDFTGVVTNDTDVYKVSLPMDKVAVKLQSNETEPVKHGKWENGHCTHCGEDVASKLDTWTDVQNFIYCPNCGSKNRMDGDSE